MEQVLPQTHIRRSGQFRRSFRPLWYWLLISACLLAWDYHRRASVRTTLLFKLTVDGEPVERGYLVKVDDRPFALGSRIPIGSHAITVDYPDVEQYKTNHFVWYGKNDLGAIHLTRRRGHLSLTLIPPAEEVVLKGPYYSNIIRNSGGTSLHIPVGDYEVSAKYAHSQEQKLVTVASGQTSRIEFKPDLGSLAISSAPEAASFLLQNKDHGISVRGQTPQLVNDLPIGYYNLRISHGDEYLIDTNVVAALGKTNPITIAFSYGQVEFRSVPEGATLYRDSRELGKTPLKLAKLKPGQYQFALHQPEYRRADFSIEVKSDESLSISTNLISNRFADALDEAKRELGRQYPNFQKALQSVEVALGENKDDADALALKSAIEDSLRKAAAEEDANRKQEALAAEKRIPEDFFRRATASFKDTEYFDTHEWVLNTDLQNARNALLRALPKTAIKWSVEQETKVNDRMLYFDCTPKGFIVMGRRASILLSQTSSDDIRVLAKFWDYQSGKEISISLFQGITSGDSVPVHKRFFKPEHAAAVDKRRQDIADNFIAALKNELR